MVVGDFPIELDTLVVGAGPGGYIAAKRASQLGQKVAIVDKEHLGGVCLNVGCIPSKALISAAHLYAKAKNSSDIGIIGDEVKVDFNKVQSWKESVVSKLTSGVRSLLDGHKVEIINGEAYFVDKNTVRIMDDSQSQTYHFKHVILATGSRPIEIPSFKYSERVIHSTGALNLKKIPEKLIVIGGGYIGIELGTAYSNFGTEVVILEGAERILSGFEKQMTQIVEKRLKKNGVTIHTNALAKGVEETPVGVTVTAEIEGEMESFTADYCLVTVGRVPNTDEIGLEKVGIERTEGGLIKIDKQCRTTVDTFFAIGDIVEGPKLAHKASYEGKVAAEVISGYPSVIDYYGIPAVCFTDPELASVGYTELEAKEEGIEVVTSKFSFQANGRALALNDSEGFVKLIARKEGNIIIGGQVVGPNASDLIAEIGLGIETCIRVEDVAMTIHAHPTLGEMTMDAAESLTSKMKHIEMD